MNVCMIVHSYYPWDIRVKRAAEALAERYNVDVICLRNDKEAKKETSGNINVYRLPVKRKRSGAFRYIYEYFLFLTLSSIKLNILHLKKRYKVIHIHTLPDFLVFSAVIPKLTGSTVILDMHEAMPEIFAARLNKKLDSRSMSFIKFIEKISMKFADQIITVNPTVKNLFIKRGTPDEKITLIMNVPDNKVLNLEENPERPDFLRGKFVLIYPGAIMEERGLTTAIKAVNILKGDISNILFLIFGNVTSGNEYYEKSLRDLVKSMDLDNHVHFGGEIPHKQVPQYIKMSDIGLIPNLSNYITELETHNKLFEYAALNKPIIASDTMALREFFGKELILFFAPGDEKDLARCVLELYKNPERAKEMTKKAKKVYEENNWEIMKKRLYGIYEKCL